MFNLTLPEKLFSIEGFQKRLVDLTLSSVRNQFPCIEQNELEIDWNYMLLCASILANSNKGYCLDAAFRIAQYCLVNKDTGNNQRTAAAVVMDTLTNSPSIRLALDRGYLNLNYEEQIPLTLLFDKLKRGIQYSIFNLEFDSIININKFQWSVYNGANSSQWVSISAPTSAGKSYMLLRILEEQYLKSDYLIGVYIVPTRALVHQVEFDITESFLKLGMKNVHISSIPSLNADWKIQPQVYIVTQERLLWILNEEPDFIPNIVIVDEAQKVGDGARGILLVQVIEELKRRSEKTKFIFSSPMSDNPEIFLQEVPIGVSCETISSEYVAVNQNLLWVSQVNRKPLEWEISLYQDEKEYPVGRFKLISRPSPESKRLPFIAFMLADKQGGNLIYANGPADAEKIALQLWDLQGKVNETNDQEVLNLIELSSKVINKKYSLNTTLKREIGFHYGNMPFLIRNEIERLFKNGKLKFLVCTSTLIEGVNLPAKSIFLRGPTKGNGKPMNEIDFWNLAGRAGRQGKEFQGNVICIDPSLDRVWKYPPPINKKKYSINKSIDEIVKNNKDELIDYILLSTPPNKTISTPELEYAFTYLLGEYIRNGTLTNLEGKYDPYFLMQISFIFEDVLRSIGIPKAILFSNPGISSISQESLLNYFREFDGDPTELIPSLPEDENALDNYVRIIGRISEYLSGDPSQLNFPHALLVLNWLRGMSLSRIIEKNWDYWKDRNKKISTVIRDTMRDLEEYARFRFLKYSSCYNDLLKYHFISQGNSELAQQVPQLRLWLEFGASQKTQISLMGIGLSRTSAIIISEYIANDSFDFKECIDWLSSIDLEILGLSPIVHGEISKVLLIHGVF
jgi:hypothetical protein